MALIIEGQSRCAICEALLGGRPYTATSGVAFAPEHPLFRYCDAPLHVDCLERWPNRVEFSSAYYHRTLESCRDGYGTLLREWPGLFLRTGPATETGFPYFVEGVMEEWPLSLYADWNDAPGCFERDFPAEFIGTALDAARIAAAKIIEVCPDRDTLHDTWRELHDPERERQLRRNLGSDD